MWLKKLITQYKDLALHLTEIEFSLDIYERIHKEYQQFGREYLIKKYNYNPTIAYKYLNSNIYEQCQEDYRFVYEKFKECERVLTMVAYFSPDLDPDDFQNEV
ncbi:hypothetical protein [Bacillus sp. OK048]|uniref:hypothetical protein n=1 Tax=Bacillus sp. OK048 TaxID=1882761 RepID=UPI000880D015|nr:hypothetical protein [Bacillus sp. OK048]SDM41959.1 hypothetical protein SAMN05443253_103247 [Bacillus sp. OK048]